MHERGKLITATGLALMVALSGCGDGETSDGKAPAATEPAARTSSGSQGSATSAEGAEKAPNDTQAKSKATKTEAAEKGGGQSEKSKAKAPPKKRSPAEGQGVPGPGQPADRQECVDYVNSLPFEGADRKRLLGFCRDYPR